MIISISCMSYVKYYSPSNFYTTSDVALIYEVSNCKINFHTQNCIIIGFIKVVELNKRCSNCLNYIYPQQALDKRMVLDKKNIHSNIL